MYTPPCTPVYSREMKVENGNWKVENGNWNVRYGLPYSCLWSDSTRRVGTRGAGGLQPPLSFKAGGSAPLKIDLVNHIQYAYSHSLLQSRLAMTVYTAIKAQ